jgi:hypothetical protein
MFGFLGFFGGVFGGRSSFRSVFTKPRYRYDVDLGGGPLFGRLFRF